MLKCCICISLSGRIIVKRNAEAMWGKSVINQLSQDLGNEFPDMKGFSPRNLAYMKQFYLFYCGDKSLQQVAAKTIDIDAESLQQVVAKSAEDNDVVDYAIFLFHRDIMFLF